MKRNLTVNSDMFGDLTGNQGSQNPKERSGNEVSSSLDIT